MQRALRTGDAEQLQVVGYGEISLVLKLDTGQVCVAAKRLPPFGSPEHLEQYRATVDAYLQRLSRGGIEPLPTRVASVEHGDGRLVAYCLQPLLPAAALGNQWLANCDTDEARWLIDEVIDKVLSAVSDRLGVDAQISNWAAIEGELRYVDVSTPLLRDERGREHLDLDLFLAALPWALRPLVRHLLLKSIVDKYYDPWAALRDIAGNFHKEGLDRWIPLFIERANARLTRPLDAANVAAYYRDDARTWELLLRLRRADRWWQRHVRKRTYPFLLPGKIDRRTS